MTPLASDLRRIADDLPFYRTTDADIEHDRATLRRAALAAALERAHTQPTT